MAGIVIHLNLRLAYNLSRLLQNDGILVLEIRNYQSQRLWFDFAQFLILFASFIVIVMIRHLFIKILADTVADTKENTSVGTPEKDDVGKEVNVADEDTKASVNGEVPKPKENGSSDENDSAEDCQDKEADSAVYDDSIDSVRARGTKWRRNDTPKHTGDDVPEHPDNDIPESYTPVEGASPVKKAKLDKPTEAEASATNGEPEAVA